MTNMKTYYVEMIDNITQETFTVAMPAVSLYEARKQAFLDWWQSSSLI